MGIKYLKHIEREYGRVLAAAEPAYSKCEPGPGDRLKRSKRALVDKLGRYWLRARGLTL